MMKLNQNCLTSSLHSFLRFVVEVQNYISHVKVDLDLHFLYWYFVLFSVLVCVSAVCPAGTEPSTSDACDECQEGWFSNGNDEMCQMCPQNQISNSSRANCGEYSSVNSPSTLIIVVHWERDWAAVLKTMKAIPEAIQRFVLAWFLLKKN